MSVFFENFVSFLFFLNFLNLIEFTINHLRFIILKLNCKWFIFRVMAHLFVLSLVFTTVDIIYLLIIKIIQYDQRQVILIVLQNFLGSKKSLSEKVNSSLNYLEIKND
jgi:hypothetical protein